MGQKLIRYTTKEYDAPSLDNFEKIQMYIPKTANDDINRVMRNFDQA